MKKSIIIISLLVIFITQSLKIFSQDRVRLNELFSMLDTVTTGGYFEAAVYQNIGIQYIYIDLDSSIFYTKIAIEKFEELDNFTEIVNANMNLAIAYYQKAEMNEAIIVIQNILPLVENNGDKYWEGRCYNLLGEFCRSAEYFDKALEYCFISKNIFKEIEHEGECAASFNRIAAIYYELQKFDLAIIYADSSLVIAEKANRTDFIILNLDILAASYKDLEQYEKSLEIYEKIILLYDYDNDNFSINILRNIAELYYKTENFEESIKYGLLAYNKAQLSNTKMYIENSSAILSKAYSKVNNYERAFYYSEISKNTYNEIFNETKNAQIAELNTKYETEKQQKEIEKQKNEIIENELILKKKQVLNYSLGIGIFLTLIVFLITLINRRKLKQINNLLKDKNHEIELQAEELKIFNDKLEELSNFKEGLTSMIVHDLKNSISTIISLSRNKEVVATSQHLLNMVSNILDVQKYENNKMILDTKAYSLCSLSDSALQSVILLTDHKNIELQNNIGSNLFIDTDKEIVNRIFLNLLTNAIKYTPDNGKITISCEKSSNSNYVKINITDNGIGVEKDKLDVVFDKFTQVIAKKSGKARSTGLGLTFCKIAVEAHGGTINVSSIPNVKTVFSFTLPISENTNLTNEKINEKEQKQTELYLNQKEEIYLSKFIEEYKKYDIYDIIPLRKITKKIDESFSENVKIWKAKMQKIVYNTNESEFKNFISKKHS